MASNTNFSLSSIDPDTLKQSFIAYLQTQNIFKDYNYNGPNINVLLDILSRNTFLNSFYVNMAYTEAQLDSAQLRNSLVSKAKVLNYIPSSITSPVAFVNVSVQSAPGNIFVIPAKTNFSGVNSNNSFNFVTDTDYIQVSSNGTFNFSNVSIYEGSYINEVFVVDTSIENQIFNLSNPSIDITSLIVSVSEEQGSQNNYFIQAEGIYDLTGNSLVYFLQGAEDNLYQFQFGDGILGYSPQNGAIVQASYRVSFGDKGNDCQTFYVLDNIGNYNNTTVTNVSITTITGASGGALEEGIESIRFNAPRAYQTQDRAITALDYKNLILKRFPQVGDVNVYGGNVTPNSVNFGTIYIAAVSKLGNPLPKTTKDIITSYLSPLTSLPVKDFINIVDANTIWLNINSLVHVNFAQTNNTPNYYQVLTTNAITSFSNNNLQKFGSSFVLSNLTTNIDKIDSNNIIIGNETTFTMQRYISVNINSNNNIYSSFNNPISGVISSQFILNGLTSIITDRYHGVTIPSGSLALINFTTNNSVLQSSIVGTIDYSKGTLSVPNFMISAYTTNVSSFYFVANTMNKVLYVENNDIFKVDSVNGITTSVING